MRFFLPVILVLVAIPAQAAPRVGFGTEWGRLGDYRDDPVAEAGITPPGHLHAFAGNARFPMKAFEVAVIGVFGWRTVSVAESTGAATLSIDQVSLALALRRTWVLKSIQVFVGAGASGHRVRYHLNPAESRILEPESFQPGGLLETGLYWQTPWRRAQVGIGLRRTAIFAPRVEGTLFWLGFSIWPEHR